MRVLTAIILFFLMLALVIQNTCPRGFAGKSMVTSGASCCAHCPLMKSRRPASKNIDLVVASRAPSRLPMYVLDMPMARPSFRVSATATPRTNIPDTYTNAAPCGPFRPPCA